jgi:hypothetical protein
VQLQQVLMNLCINSIDAMKDVDGTRELIVKSQGAENEHLMVSVSDTGVGCPRSRWSRSSMPSLLPSPTGPAWDFASAAPSSNRMVAACGLPTTSRGGSLYFTLPTKGEANE